MKFTSDTAKQMGRRGGKRTAELHGADHMRKIGRRGFWKTCELHYGGDARLMVNTLIKRGLMAGDPMPYNGAWSKERVSNRLPKNWSPVALEF